MLCPYPSLSIVICSVVLRSLRTHQETWGQRYLCETLEIFRNSKRCQTCPYIPSIPTLSSGLSGDDLTIRSYQLKAWVKCMKSTWSLLPGSGGGSTEHEARYCENVIFNSCPSEPAASMWPRRHCQRSKTLESNWWTMQAIFEMRAVGTQQNIEIQWSMWCQAFQLSRT